MYSWGPSNIGTHEIQDVCESENVHYVWLCEELQGVSESQNRLWILRLFLAETDIQPKIHARSPHSLP